MKTLRMLRNMAALFIFVTALVISRSSVGFAASSHGHCIHTTMAVRCIKSGHSCYTYPCLNNANCGHSYCGS